MTGTKETVPVELIHARSGKKIPIEIEVTYYPDGRHFVRTQAFGLMGWKLLEMDGKKCLSIKSVFYKEFKAPVERFFATTLRKQNLGIEINDKTYQQGLQVIKQAARQAQQLSQEHNERALNQPVFYLMYDFQNWGDYVISHERTITKMREALPQESGDQVVAIYSFLDASIHDKAQEWREDLKAQGIAEKVGESKRIPSGLAEKWIAYRSEFAERERHAEQQEQAVRQHKMQQQEEERLAKFAQAKSSGKPVLLYQTVCHEDDLPVSLREDESDIVHVYGYAMPDGTTKEEYSHCY